MGLRRKYCLRGNAYWHAGEIETNVGDKSSYRKVKDLDPEIAYYDGPLHCFREENQDCFDEDNMWCKLNDCSVFECNRVYWKHRRERVAQNLKLIKDQIPFVRMFVEKGNELDIGDLGDEEVIKWWNSFKKIYTSYLKQYEVQQFLKERERFD